MGGQAVEEGLQHGGGQAEGVGHAERSQGCLVTMKLKRLVQTIHVGGDLIEGEELAPAHSGAADCLLD